MKTILTFIGGSDRDEVILQTALAAAIPLSARLDFLHAHVPSVLAAQHTKLDFAPAGVLSKELTRLEADAKNYSFLAADHVRSFCANQGIEIGEAADDTQGLRATFFEERTNKLEGLGLHASRRDLIVIGRARQKQGLAPDTLEYLVRKSGRPVLAVGRAAPINLTGTVMVCWKADGSTVAAVRDASPLLRKARRVVCVCVAKRDTGQAAAIEATAREIAKIDVEVRVVQPQRRSIPEALVGAADECAADLLVTGAYGCSRGREILFGSCTDQVLTLSDRPILLRH